MKVLVAPDSFKGSLTALEAAENIKKGIKNFDSEIEVDLLPLADGGEGTVQSLVDAAGGEIIKKEVKGPLGDKVTAFYGLLREQNTAVIEMAAASGLPLLSEEERNPLKTTTYGTGELIKAALDKGVEKIIIGIGGSATNDAGVGMAQALGAKITDKNGGPLAFGGESLAEIKNIDLSTLDPRLKKVEILAACDVDNPLYGKNGAAYVYAAQKGADQEMIEVLDRNLRKFNQVVKQELGVDSNIIAGAGAAGGLGAGLAVFLGAELKSGIEIILNSLDFESRLEGVDLLITGEGMLDGQSIYGKVPTGAAERAQAKKIAVIALAGSLGEGVEKVLDHGIDAYFSIIDRPADLETIMAASPKLLSNLSEQLMRVLSI